MCRLMCLIGCASILFDLALNAGLELSLQQVAEENIDSLRYIEEEYPDEEYYPFLQRILGYQLQPNARKKRRLFFELYAQTESSFATVESSIQEQGWRDLHILSGKRKLDPYFAQCVGDISTEIGKVVHYGIVSRPIVNSEIISQRQRLIRWLAERPGLRQEIKSRLRTIATTENGFIALWAHDGFRKASERCYYRVPELFNNYSSLLQLKYAYDTGMLFAGLTANCIAAGLLSGYVCKQVGLSNSLCPNQDRARSYQSAPGSLYGAFARLSDDRIFQALISSYAVYYCLMQLKPDAEWLRDREFIVECIEHKMSIIVDTIRQLRSLERLLRSYPELEAMLCSVGGHLDLYIPSAEVNSSLDELFSTINTFSSGSKILRKGCALRLFRLLAEHKNILCVPYTVIGYLDAFCSIADLIDDTENLAENKPRYALAEFIESSSPQVALIDFWNPFIDKKNAVVNSIEIGGSAPRNGIISGANAGGKSTVTRAIILNIILAQTYGIVAARSAQLTLFHTMLTSMNIGDNVIEGHSKFKAEVLRMYHIIHAIEEAHDKDQFSIALIDEPFSGTASDVGASAAWNVLQTLSSYPRHMSLVVTHFREITSAAEESDTFVNYHVDGIVQADGTIYYPFKLLPGASDTNIALQMLQQHGLS